MDSTNRGDSSPERGVSRRTFLRGTTGAVLVGTAGLSVLLNACGESAATAPSSAAGAAPSTAGAAAPSTSGLAGAPTAKTVKSVLPTYNPIKLPFKADFPSTGVGIDDAYTSFPKTPFKSVTDVPGTGSTINVVSGSAWPPYTPADQNPMLKELQKQLNVKLNLNITTISDYGAKFTTLLAGQDLPDVFWVGSTPNMVDFLKAQCADLTPFLAGDAVKDYPNLANLLTTTWKSAVFGGAIMGLPSPLGAMGWNIQVNKTRWDAEIGPNVLPKNADDFKKMMVALTHPNDNKWAMATGSSDPYGVQTGWFAMMYGAPNNWGIINGKLTNYRETEAYKQSIAYTRDLVQAGVFHPKSATYDSVALKADHLNGQLALTPTSTFYGNHVDMWNRGAGVTPQVKFDIIPTIAADGGKTTYWLSPQIWPRSSYLGPGIWAFKKAAPDRVKELLRVWNFICGPFGSQERLLWEYGVKDIDYIVDDKGNPIPTKNGPADSTFVPIRFGPHSPDQLYNPATPDYGPTMQKHEQDVIPTGILDATIGAYSATDGAKSAPLDKTFFSGMVDIVAGRRPVSDVDQLVKEWVAAGGDTIRKEYEQGLAAQ